MSQSNGRIGFADRVLSPTATEPEVSAHSGNAPLRALGRHDFVPAQPGQSRKSLYGAPTTRRGGGIEHADTFGTNLAMRSAEPPPVAEYDAFVKSRNVRFCATNHTSQQTGFRLRRIVVMRRQGATWKECGEAVGVGPGAAKNWVEFLPLALAP